MMAAAAQTTAKARPAGEARNSGRDREYKASIAVTAMRLTSDPNLLTRSLNRFTTRLPPFDGNLTLKYMLFPFV